MGPGSEPVKDDEVLYRRIPDSIEWYDPSVSPHPSSKAFRPKRHDPTGISLYRARHVCPERIGGRSSQKPYYVAVVRAGDLRAHGMCLLATPGDANGPPGHVEVTNLRYGNRREDRQEEWQALLADPLCREVLGPFAPAAPEKDSE